jgi:hypothetical protein
MTKNNIVINLIKERLLLMENMNSYYNDEFYQNQSIGSYKSAKIVLGKVFEMLPEINSAVDFGCGIGTWLNALQELGVKEIKGMMDHG